MIHHDQPAQAAVLAEIRRRQIAARRREVRMIQRIQRARRESEVVAFARAWRLHSWRRAPTAVPDLIHHWTTPVDVGLRPFAERPGA
jgi:hypothetical protein